MAKFNNDILKSEELDLGFNPGEPDDDTFTLGDNEPYPAELPNFSATNEINPEKNLIQDKPEIENISNIFEEDSISYPIADIVLDDIVSDNLILDIPSESINSDEIDLGDENLANVWDAFDSNLGVDFESLTDLTGFDDFSDNTLITENPENNEIPNIDNEVNSFLSDIMGESQPEIIEEVVAPPVAEPIIENTPITPEIEQAPVEDNEIHNDLKDHLEQQKAISNEAKEILDAKTAEQEKLLGVLEKDNVQSGEEFFFSVNDDLFKTNTEKPEGKKTKQGKISPDNSPPKTKKKSVFMWVASILILIIGVGFTSLYFFGDKVGINIEENLVALVKGKQEKKENIEKDHKTKNTHEEKHVKKEEPAHEEEPAREVEPAHEQEVVHEKEIIHDKPKTETHIVKTAISHKPMKKNIESIHNDSKNSYIKKRVYLPSELQPLEEDVAVNQTDDVEKFTNPAENEIGSKSHSKPQHTANTVKTEHLSENSHGLHQQSNKTLPSINPESGIFVVQCYASTSKVDAQEWFSVAKNKNLPNLSISEYKKRDVIWYRVRFGNYSSMEEAKSAARKYGFSNIWIDRIK